MSIEADAFRERLLPGERVLWSGRPATGLLFTARDAFLIPFSVLWCGFAITWAAAVAFAGGGAFALFGLLFVTIGVFFMVGRFLFDAWLRETTRYALTNERVLILKTKPSADFAVLTLGRLPEVRLTERRDGRGTVHFGQPASIFGFGRTGFSIWAPSLDPTPQFLAIADARRIFDLVQQTNRARPPNP